MWLTPVVALCAWVGGSALPSLTAEAEGNLLCSAGSAAARPAQPGTGLLRKVRTGPASPVETVPGMPPVLDAANL